MRRRVEMREGPRRTPSRRHHGLATAALKACAISAVRETAASVVAPLFTSQTATHPSTRRATARPRRAARKTRARGPLRVEDARERAFAEPLCAPYISSFSLLIPFSSLSSLPLFLPLLSLPHREGRAERRWRLDACDAPRSARHTRSRETRVNALVTGVQTPHRTTGPSKRARLAFVAHHRSPVAAFDMRRSASPICVEASCRPGEGTLAFRRSTWDFWPGPVLAVVRPPSPKASGIRNHPSETSFEGLSGQPRHALRDRAAYATRVIVTRRSGSREPPRRGR